MRLGSEKPLADNQIVRPMPTAVADSPQIEIAKPVQPVSFYPISNKPSFRQEHPGVSDGPDGSDGTSYPLTENQTRPVA
jgi:hypothetical protein